MYILDFIKLEHTNFTKKILKTLRKRSLVTLTDNDQKKLGKLKKAKEKQNMAVIFFFFS